MKDNFKLRNKRWEEDFFLAERKAVLDEHESGRDVNIREAVDYLKSVPNHKVLVNVLTKAEVMGDTCLIAGMGHAGLDDHIDLVKYIQNEGSAHFLGTTVDSFTRDHNFQAAERGLQESIKAGRNMLNGLPVCAHGLKGMRRLFESVNVPMQSRFAAYDPRLIHEIIFAAGHTGNSGSAMFTFWNYNKKTSLEKVLYYYQHVYRLQGYYHDHGIPMCDCPYGVSPVLTPPSSAIIGDLSQVLMMAEQGIKYLLVAFPCQGNLIQDVACANVFFKLCRSYLDRFGYEDVKLFREVYYIFGRFPANPIECFIITGMNMLIAKLVHAQVAYIRTVSEHGPIPMKEDYGSSYRAANFTRELLRYQVIDLDPRLLEAEGEMFEREVRFIFDRMLDMGDGDACVAIARGIESGLMDNPWPTHPSVAGKVLGVRDSEGAVRYFDMGSIPFPNDIREYHREKISGRAQRENRAVDYNTIVYDLLAIGEGSFIKPVPEDLC